MKLTDLNLTWSTKNRHVRGRRLKKKLELAMWKLAILQDQRKHSTVTVITIAMIHTITVTQ